MSTVKPKATPATPSVASPLPDATAQAAVKTPAAQQATAGKLAAKKPAAKKLSTARKPVTKAPPSKTRATVKPEKEVKTGQTVKLEKTRKPKLVRDSFTIPKVEYVVLEALKQRANGLGRAVKKSELLRAGIKALAAMHDTAFVTALELVPAIKTGRPVSEK
ncbi:MAG: hypothetical protein EAZ34_03090 [Polaromonas sp.]|nr:MAG: hypothetical protein EAZ34_03090 [Polaromonas sp.]